MVIFLDQNPGLTPLEKCQFFDFFNFLFLQPRKSFFRSRMLLRILSWPILSKKKRQKNVNFSTFKSFCFYSLERRIFVPEYRYGYFLGLYCLKKKVAKMAKFGPKPQVNPFGKMSIFRLFELLVFIGQNGVFSFQNIVEDIFLAYIV